MSRRLRLAVGPDLFGRVVSSIFAALIALFMLFLLVMLGVGLWALCQDGIGCVFR